MTATQKKPTRRQAWILGARPKTLPAAAAPVIVGAAIALSEGVFRLWPVLAALAGALLIQIATNYANDLFDFKKGADTHDRLGPTRVTQAGFLSPQAVMWGMGAAFGLAALIGVYLVYEGGWPIIVIGVLSIVAGIAYTAGPYPLGYNGLGDLFVFLFFGLAAVCGTYYVQAGVVSPAALWLALPMGALATAILVVNNLRDVETDRRAGKRTMAVRLGVNGARIEYLLLLLVAYLVPLITWLNGLTTVWVLAAWLSLPLVPALVRAIYRQQGRALNQTLAGTARLELAYALLLSLGLVGGGLIGL